MFGREKMMNKIALVIFTVLFSHVAHTSQDEVYLLFGIEHLSSPTDGEPFNDKREASIDMPYVGIKYHKASWDMNFQFDVGHVIQDTEMDGHNPRFEFRIEKQFRIK